jgi:hypothetical protein
MCVHAAALSMVISALCFHMRVRHRVSSGVDPPAACCFELRDWSLRPRAASRSRSLPQAPPRSAHHVEDTGERWGQGLGVSHEAGTL